MSSKTWLYFTKIPQKSDVKCKECNEIVNRKDSNTSSMIKHLKRRHGIEVASSEPVVDQKQPMIVDCLAKKKRLDRDAPRAKEITAAVARFISVDMQPLDVVNDTGFSKLMHVLEPRYVIKNYSQISCH